MNFDDIRDSDAATYEALQDELDRQQNTLTLIASENHVSPAVLQAQGSVLTNKYAEGYPEKRYYAGCENADTIENLARDRACALWNASHANVQPHSGSQANHAVYNMFLDPGDTILSLELEHGGHLSHGADVNFSGQLYDTAHYEVNAESGRIDYNALHARAREVDPDMIVSGFSAYPRTVEWDSIQAAANDVGALHLADMAHITGLCATGHHPNPVDSVDIVTGSTHKTIRAGRGGMILTQRDDLADKIDKAVFPGVQGGPAMHNIAGKAVGFAEAQTEAFTRYIDRVVKTAEAMADELDSAGISLVSGGTDIHLALADLRDSHPNLSGGEAEEHLAEVGIILNANTVPDETRSPFNPSGIRVGTPAIASRGFSVDEAREVADAIVRILDNPDDPTTQQNVRETVTNLCQANPIYEDRSY